MNDSICVLGLGLMGSRIARRLVDNGHKVVAWNRTTPAKDSAIRDVVSLAASPCEAVKDASVVLMLLHDAKAVADVLFKSGAAQCLADDCLVVDMGTNNPDAARFVAAKLPNFVRFVDGPVSGGTKGAEQGTLSIFLGAANENVALARTALADLGRVSHMGDVGAGQAAKLANQIVVACSIAGLAEGVAFGEKFGIAPETLTEAMRGGLADSRILDTIGARISSGDFDPLGKASTHLKDLDYAFSQIGTDPAQLPSAEAARKILLDLLKNHGDLDHAAMVLVARETLSKDKDILPLDESPKLEPQVIKS